MSFLFFPMKKRIYKVVNTKNNSIKSLFYRDIYFEISEQLTENMKFSNIK
jgi:hypothetical protein